MTQGFGMVRAPAAPVGEEAQGAGQVATVGRQRVLHSRRPLLVRPGMDDALAVEASQTVGQDVRRYPRDGGLQLPEPARAVEQRLDQEKAPAVPHPIEGGLERTGRSVVGHRFHGRRGRCLHSAPCQ